MPGTRGDTIWVNMVEAYKQLPEDVKAKIEGLRAAHSVEQVFGAKMPIEKRQALAARTRRSSIRS
jgi:taurine dioxygenase